MLALITNSLRNKLILLFVMVAVVPLIAASMFSFTVSRNAMIEEVKKNNVQIATALSRELEIQVNARLKMLQTASKQNDIVKMDPTDMIADLKILAGQFEDMRTVFVTDLTGQQIARNEGKLNNIADRQYFQEIIKGSAYSVSDVLISKASGKSSIILSVPVKNFEGQLIGVISGSVDLEQFSACLKHQQSGSSYAFIVDKTGKVLAHPSADAVKEQRDLTALEPVKKAILGETGVAFYAYENVRKVAGYTFMPTTRWGVVMQVPEEEALAGVQKIKYTALLSAVVAIIFACMLGFLIARAVTKPIKQMAEASEIVAAGDLTHTVSIENQDEMGKLAGSFNLMVSNLRNLVSQVVVNAETVSASAQQLWASSSEASKAVEQIALTAGELAAGAQNQTCEAATTARTMQELATSAKEVAQKAESAAFLAQDVVSSAQVGNTSVHKAVEQMLEIDGAITTTADLVKELGLRSSEIGNIVEVIANIAGQTNLLALNAAIEAARAGEQGRGFAVVADEVRKLAEQAQGAAGQIAEIVNQIQGQTSAAVTAMDNGTRKVEEGVQVAKDAGIAIDSILSKVNQSVSMIESISAAAQQQAASTNEVVKSVNNVAAIAEQSGVGAETTATATEETTASMEEIAASSQALADTAVELQKLVQQFKV